MAADPVQPAPESASESWVKLPPAKWPQLVLTNAAEFRGHSALQGASAFLVRAPDGRILAATARHLLGDAGGVEPPLTVEKLAADLAAWKLFPRTKPTTTVTVAGLGYPVPVEENLDWLLLTLAPNNNKKLPATPLNLRAKPVEVGEELFLVGVPYSEPKRAQNVYRCRVTARAFGDFFRYTVDPPVDISGFSGAPILDTHGQVVGVMTVWFEAPKQGDKFLEAGGEDAASVLKALAAKP